MIVTLTTLAFAGPHVGGTVQARPADASEPVRAGLAGAQIWELPPGWVDLGLGANLGWGDGPWAMVGPDALIGAAHAPRAVLGARAGWAGAAAGRLQAGFHVPLGAVHVESVASWRFDGTPAGAELRVFYAPQPEPVVEPEPEPEPQPEPEPTPEAPPVAPLDVSPDEALVWLPHPVCAWVAPSQVPAEGLAGLTARVHADGYLPADVAMPSSDPLSLQEAPAQGVVVIAARPGDTVQVNELDVDADHDGWAMAVMAEGIAVVTVRGGGRVVVEEVAVASGHTTWVRVAEPTQGSLLLRFAVSSSTVSAGDARQLQELAAALGEHHITLQGSSSPEGDAQANRVLANRRAAASSEVLKAAGVPEAQIHFLDPTEPDPYRPYEEQRAVLVHISPEAP